MTMTSDQIEGRFEAAHLDEPEKMKEVLEADISGKKQSRIDPDHPMAQKHYTFRINYTDNRGRVWEGEFTSKILSIRERQNAGALRARMSGGAALDSLDALTTELNLMLAHMAYSLTDRPDWAKDLSSLEDIGLIQAIYTEVAAHEANFLGWGEN